MGYDSDFYTTRRTYSRPVVTSYTYTTPIRFPTVKSTVYSYTTSYPIYTTVPYVVHKQRLVPTISRTIIPSSRYLTAPSVRVITSPVRVVTSPVRVIRSPVRVIHSPVRMLRTSPVRVTYSPVRAVRTPIRVITSPTRVISLRPSILNRELHRIENKVRSRPGYRPLEDYLNSDDYINFDEETRSIRTATHNMLKTLQPPITRRSRSTTPFPVTSVADKYLPKSYDSIDDLTYGLNKLSYHHHEPTVKHDTSVKFIGKKGYTTRNPLCDLDKVRTDVEMLSHYRKNRFAAQERLAKAPQLESARLAKEVPACG